MVLNLFSRISFSIYYKQLKKTIGINIKYFEYIINSNNDLKKIGAKKIINCFNNIKSLESNSISFRTIISIFLLIVAIINLNIDSCSLRSNITNLGIITIINIVLILIEIIETSVMIYYQSKYLHPFMQINFKILRKLVKLTLI